MNPDRATVHRAPWGPRKWLGASIALLGVVAIALQFADWLEANERVAQAWRGGMVAALATALGTVPVMFSQRLSEKVQDTLFGFGAGVMLAASSFSLIIPGLAAAREAGAGAIRTQPVFCLLRVSLLESLVQFTQAGGRKIDRWTAQHACATVAFEQPGDDPRAFRNANTVAELHALEAAA